MASLKKLMSGHKAWVLKNSEGIEARELGLLEKWMPTLAAKRLSIGDSLNSLALVHGVRGVVEVGSGNSEGWQSVAYSMDLRGWACRIRLDHRGVNLTNYLSQMACLACCSSSWQAELVIGLKRALAPGALSPGYWEKRIFEPFVLSALTSGPPTAGKDVYADVVDSWDEPELLVEALIRVCDYHVKNATDRRDWDAEFRHPPFDLLPVEVMLVQRLKAAEGVDLPPIRHELVDCLQAPSDLPSVPITPLLKWVEANYARGY
jgi:hypothetical protein